MPRPDQSGLALGAVLVIVGLILLGAQVYGIGFDEVRWPFWIIGAGLAILVVALIVVNETPMVIGGTVLTTVGLVLLYQDATDHWESWAYAWALVGPAASGLGIALWGLRNADGGAMRNGTWGLLGGLAIFAVGFLFFEGLLGISGRRFPLPEWALPAAIIGIGLVILLRALSQRRRPQAS